MPINSLFPGFVKLFYTSNGHSHVQTIPVQPYLGVGGVWFLSEKGSSVGRAWAVSFADYVAQFKNILHTSNSVGFAELWTLDNATADPVFREAFDFSGAGLSAGTVIPFLQSSIAWRADDGGLYRWVMVENLGAVNTSDPPPFAAPYEAFRTYMLGGTSCVSARSGGFLVAALRLLHKTNDKLREKFLLDV